MGVRNHQKGGEEKLGEKRTWSIELVARPEVNTPFRTNLPAFALPAFRTRSAKKKSRRMKEAQPPAKNHFISVQKSFRKFLKLRIGILLQGGDRRGTSMLAKEAF